MTVSKHRDANGEMVDRYRQASAELNERPAASLRASIVAAAAREVGARPISADSMRRNRPRWPLAAAAAVMLSTLAVMMAIRTNEEMPQFNARPEARGAADSVATPAATAPAPPIAESPAAPRAAGDQAAPERQRAPAQERSVARLKKESDAVAQSSREIDRPLRMDVPAAGRLKKDSDAVEQAPRDVRRPAPTEAPATARFNEMRNSELKNAEQKSIEREKTQRTVPAAAAVPPAPASPAPAPPPEPAARAKSRAEQSAAGAAAESPAMDQASSDARRDAAKPAVPAPLSAAQEERKQTEESAAAWLERIVKLRREGQHAEADAELKRFRERYPQVQPPAEALLPAGTR